MSYVQGTVVRVWAEFETADTGAPFDPADVILRIERPGAVATEMKLSAGQVVNDATAVGKFYADVDTTQGPSGTWHYQFESVGPTKVVRRNTLTIRSRI